MSECDGIDSQSTWHKVRCAGVFRYFVILDLVDRDDSGPQLSFIHPLLQDKDKNLVSSQLPQFCFPDGTAVRKLEKYVLLLDYSLKLTCRNEETFFFTLKGSSLLYVPCSKDSLLMFSYGYCTRLFVSSKSRNINSVLCFLTEHSCYSLFNQMLSFLSKNYAWLRSKSDEQLYQIFDFILLQPLSPTNLTSVVFPQMVCLLFMSSFIKC